MTHGAYLHSFSFLFSLLITSNKWISHQYMLLTWLLPRSPFALLSADPRPGMWLHIGLWWWITYQRSYGGFCIVQADSDNNDGSFIVLADGDNNGRSCIVLASDSGGGPRLRWQLMVDPDGGSWQWLWTMVASDRDGGSWSWWLLIMDYDYNKTAWYTIFLLRYLTIEYHLVEG